eukprot:2613130-Amphidinium_carterae.1
MSSLTLHGAKHYILGSQNVYVFKLLVARLCSITLVQGSSQWTDPNNTAKDRVATATALAQITYTTRAGKQKHTK